MKKAFFFVVIVLIFLCTITVSNAHSGGTDSSGGHTNSATGEYHYHHGYPAHQHPGGVCPYQSNSSSGGSSSGGSSSSRDDTSDNTQKIICGVITFVASLCFGIFLSIKDIDKTFKNNVIATILSILLFASGIAIFISLILQTFITICVALGVFLIFKLIGMAKKHNNDETKNN